MTAAPIVDTTASRRRSRVFITRYLAPALPSEALRAELWTHRVPSNGFPCPHKHENRPNKWSVGCTTRSASPLSAHFRGRHQRIRLFTLLPSTEVPVREPDFRREPEWRSIPNLPYPPKRSSRRGGSSPRSRCPCE